MAFSFIETDINITSTIINIFKLILFMLAFSVLFLGCFWLIYKIFAILGKWLYKRKVVIYFCQKCQDLWNKNKVQVISFWEFASEIFIDPIFYGYLLYTLVQRLQSIANYAKSYPKYNFMQLLDLDMRTDMQYYIVLFIIFALWMFWKAWKHRQQIRFEKSINEKLDKLLGNNRNNINVGKINAKIKQELENISNKKQNKR